MLFVHIMVTAFLILFKGNLHNFLKLVSLQIMKDEVQ